MRLLLLAAVALAGCGGAGSSGPPAGWPPTVGEAYPDLTLLDAGGQRVKLSSFKGKVILVEFAAFP